MKTIRLYHPHTHEGITYTPPPEGSELTVNDADATLLEAWGLTTPPPALNDAPTREANAVVTLDAHTTTPDDDRVVSDVEDTDA